MIAMMARPTHARRGGARGATLIELVVAIVIIATAVLGLAMVIAGTVGRSSDPLVEHQAGAIAQAYMEEVMQANFCDPNFLLGGQTCRQQCQGRACSSAACGGIGALHESTRAIYDDVCDYDGLSDDGAHDRNGNGIAGLASYHVNVRIVDAGVTLGNPAIRSDDGEVLRVDVSVNHPALSEAIGVSAFRANTQ